MSSPDLKIEGLNDLIELLRKGQKKAHSDVAKVMYQFAEEVMTESKQIVPVKTGALMATGKVLPPVESAGVITVELGYGDNAIGYAIYVHEELQSPSGNPINYTRPGSGPKYLQTPFDQKSDLLAPRIAAAYQNAYKP